MAASWLASVVAMSVATTVYYLVVSHLPNDLVYLASLGIPLVGAAAGAFVAPRQKFKLGFSTVFPAVVLIPVLSYVAGRIGVGDDVGLKGTLIGMLLSMPFIIAASAAGALFGEWVSRGKADA